MITEATARVRVRPAAVVYAELEAQFSLVQMFLDVAADWHAVQMPPIILVPDGDIELQFVRPELPEAIAVPLREQHARLHELAAEYKIARAREWEAQR